MRFQTASTKLQTNPGFGFGILILFVICNLGFVILLLPQATDAGLIVQRPLYIGLTNGLVGYWSFDAPDMAGVTAYDRSGSGNNGILTNGPVRATGRIGQALEFDGSDDVMDALSPTTLDGLGPMTVSAWVNPRSVGEGSAGAIVFKGTASGSGFWRFSLTTTNTLQFTKDFATTDLQRTASNSVITLNTWQHVLLTWDGSATAANARIYVNNTEVSYQTTTDGVGTQNSDATLNLFIGNDSAGGVTFDGLVDDVRIYNRALTTDEIKRLYRIGATLKLGVTPQDALTNGLVGHWTFDGPDMAGERAFDRSGNANTGLLTNGPVRTAGRIGQALDFDGSNDRVNAGSATILDNMSAITVSAWIYARSYSSSGDHIIAKAQNGASFVGWRIAGNSSNFRLLFEVGYPTTDLKRESSSNALKLNFWQHITITWDGSSSASNAILYFDGVAATSYAATTDGVGTRDDDSARSFSIAANDGGFNLFDGLIDEVRIYNRVLTTDEITRLYRIGATLKLGVTRTDTLTNGLVGHWTFDGPDMAGERAFDRSGNANTGLLTNGPVRATGRIGQALEFDGSNDRVAISASASLNNLPALSVSFWVYMRNSPTGSLFRFVGKGAAAGDSIGWYIYKISGSGRLILEVDHATTNLLRAAGSSTVTSNEWLHFVITWDGSTSASNVHTYKNGAETSYVTTTDAAGARDDDSGDALALAAANNGFSFLDGRMDEVRIYNRVLTPDEILRLYSMGR